MCATGFKSVFSVRDTNPIDQVRQFPTEKVIPYLRQKIPFFPYLN